MATLTVTATSPSGALSFVLPSNLSGDVLVRVVDTNQSDGATGEDTVFVDHMAVTVQ